MPAWIVSIFILLHGLAHMVYTAVARNWVPAPPNQPDLTGSSWLLSGPLGAEGSRSVGAVIFTALTLAFAVAAISFGLRLPSAPVILAVCALASSLALIAFWNGEFTNLGTQGLVGLVINLVLLAAIYFHLLPTR